MLQPGRSLAAYIAERGLHGKEVRFACPGADPMGLHGATVPWDEIACSTDWLLAGTPTPNHAAPATARPVGLAPGHFEAWPALPPPAATRLPPFEAAAQRRRRHARRLGVHRAPPSTGGRDVDIFNNTNTAAAAGRHQHFGAAGVAAALAVLAAALASAPSGGHQDRGQAGSPASVGDFAANVVSVALSAEHALAWPCRSARWADIMEAEEWAA